LTTTKGGFVLTLVISVTFHATDYLLNDQKTWHDLVAGVAVDMAVVGAAIVTTSTILGVASAASAGLATIIAGTVLVPLLVVVIVGVAFSIAFSDTSDYVKVLSDELRNIENKIQSGVVKIKAGAQKINSEYKENPNEFLHETFGVPMFKKTRSYNL
jgi:predicted PurR-regulated permease PerM